MGQRADSELFFEEFTLVHFLGTDRESDRHLELPEDPSYTYANLFYRLRQRKQSESKRKVAFVKDFATSFPKWRWDDPVMAQAEHAFLIRHPQQALASMYSIVTMAPNATGYAYFDAEEVGYEAQLDLFRHLEKRTGKRPVVVDHADLMQNPRATLTKFCAALDIPFDPAMLMFTNPLPPHANGLWDGFFEKVNASKGFNPSSNGPRLQKLPEELQSDADRLEPGYFELHQHRVA
jgi:hypothetical protein